MKFEYPEGATPIDPDEAKALRLPHIIHRDQLNRWKQENILKAEIKYFSRKQKNILSESFLLRLHKTMFGNVWKWKWSSCAFGNGFSINQFIRTATIQLGSIRFIKS